MSESSTPSATRRRLSRDDWIRAALDTLARDGLAAVGIEALARRLGVTKGSFYAHFSAHEELIDCALERWEREHNAASLEILAGAEEPLDQLRALFRAAVAFVAEGRPSPHVALMGELHDPRVRAVLARVTESRIAFLTAAYRRAGLAPARARHRARLTYAAYVGILHLAREDPQAAGDTRALRALLREVEETFFAGLES